MSAIVKFYYTVNSKLAELPIVDGQIIFVSDTKKFYLDIKTIQKSKLNTMKLSNC